MSNIGNAPKHILTDVLGSNIFESKKLAYMHEGDKNSVNYLKGGLNNTLRARSANPFASTSTDTTVMNSIPRTLTIVESAHEFDPNSYKNYWRDYQPEGEFNFEKLPKKVQATLEQLFLSNVKSDLEGALTNGATGVTTGIIPQLSANATTELQGGVATLAQMTANSAIGWRAKGNNQSGTSIQAVTLTSANILGKLQLLINGQTRVMQGREHKKFMVSFATANLMMEAQRLNLNYKGVDVTEAGVLKYAGHDVIINTSFPNNTILFCSMSGNPLTDAIQMATSKSKDLNSLKVGSPHGMGRTVGMVLTFAIDIYVVRREEVCFYTSTTLS